MIANQDNDNQEGKQLVKAKRVAAQGEQEQEEQEPGERAQKCSLTRKQAAVLQVIMNPVHHDKTNAEKAKLAGVSERLLYLTLQDAEVESQRQQMVKRMVIQGVAPAVDAMLKTASVPGRDSFQDRRLLLAMSGDYVERKTQDVNVRATLVGVVGVQMEQL